MASPSCSSLYFPCPDTVFSARECYAWRFARRGAAPWFPSVMLPSSCSSQRDGGGSSSRGAPSGAGRGASHPRRWEGWRALPEASPRSGGSSTPTSGGITLPPPEKVSADDRLVGYETLLVARFLDILQGLHGGDFRQVVEECLRLSGEYHGDGDPARLDELGALLTSLDVGDAIMVASSFSHMLSLANIPRRSRWRTARRRRRTGAAASPTRPPRPPSPTSTRRSGGWWAASARLPGRCSTRSAARPSTSSSPRTPRRPSGGRCSRSTRGLGTA